MRTLICFWLVFSIGVPAQSSGGKQTVNSTDEQKSFRITCEAFSSGTPIPALYTGDDRDISPPLRWTGVPAEAKSLLLICDDPDAPAGTWVHWVVYNINPQLTGLNAGIPNSPTAIEGSYMQGRNSWERIGYRGPAPPPGKPHRYFFKLYALDSVLPLRSGATKEQTVAAAKGHVVGQTAVMGTYQRVSRR